MLPPPPTDAFRAPVSLLAILAALATSLIALVLPGRAVAAEADGRLANLTTSVALNEAFAPGAFSYSLDVPLGVEQITVTLQPMNDAVSVLTINGIDVRGGEPPSADIDADGTPIMIEVVSPDGLDASTYTITVNLPASGDATLQALAVGAGALSPAFAPGTLAYTVAASSATTATAVTPTVNHGGSTVTVNGVAVASGTSSALIALPPGATTITVIVTAEDTSITRTYTVTVNRSASTDGSLSSLVLSGGAAFVDPFVPTGSFFDVLVPLADASVTVTPTASHPNATITVEGTPVASGAATAPIALPLGATHLEVRVTAEAGTTRTYFLSLYRGSTDATLASLGVADDTGPYVLAFDPATLVYDLDVSLATSRVRLLPVSGHAGALINVGGVAVASGDWSGWVILPAGATTTISVQVWPENRHEPRIYRLHVTREAPPPPPQYSVTLPGMGISVLVTDPVVAPPGSTGQVVLQDGSSAAGPSIVWANNAAQEHQLLMWLVATNELPDWAIPAANRYVAAFGVGIREVDGRLTFLPLPRTTTVKVTFPSFALLWNLGATDLAGGARGMRLADQAPEDLETAARELVLAYWGEERGWVEVETEVTLNEDGSADLQAVVDRQGVYTVLHQPGRGRLSQEPAPDGVTLVTWGGGPISLLPEADSYWLLADGRMFGYVTGAPVYVNAAFLGRFPEGRIPPGQPLLVTR